MNESSCFWLQLPESVTEYYNLKANSIYFSFTEDGKFGI